MLKNINSKKLTVEYFRTLSNIYDGVFFAKIVDGSQLFLQKAPSRMFDRILHTSLHEVVSPLMPGGNKKVTHT